MVLRAKVGHPMGGKKGKKSNPAKNSVLSQIARAKAIDQPRREEEKERNPQANIQKEKREAPSWPLEKKGE